MRPVGRVSRPVPIGNALPLTTNALPTATSLTPDCSSVTMSPPMMRVTATSSIPVSCILAIVCLARRPGILAVALGILRVLLGVAVGALFSRSVAVVVARGLFGLLEFRGRGMASWPGAVRVVSSPGGSVMLGGAVCPSVGAVWIGSDAAVLASGATGTVVTAGGVRVITIVVAATITILTVTNDRMTQETMTPTVSVLTASMMRTTVVLFVVPSLVVFPIRPLPVCAPIVMTPWMRAVERGQGAQEKKEST